MWGAGHRVALVLATLTVLLSVVPAAAWELQGEHRLMVAYTGTLEVRSAEALVVQLGERWLEFVVTQRLSPAQAPRLEAETSWWRRLGRWDIGVGLLWRVTEGRVEPWILVARPW